jgi:glycosyltransferase involved in cell wall biosynthesis
MDFLLLTSISEGQPLAVLEGMACSKPFITTDVGCCRELLYGFEDDFGDAGIVVPVMDYQQLGQAMLKLARDPELRKTMGENGLRRVAALYTKEQFISGYRRIYHEYGRDWSSLGSGLN